MTINRGALSYLRLAVTYDVNAYPMSFAENNDEPGQAVAGQH